MANFGPLLRRQSDVPNLNHAFLHARPETLQASTKWCLKQEASNCDYNALTYWATQSSSS